MTIQCHYVIVYDYDYLAPLVILNYILITVNPLLLCLHTSNLGGGSFNHVSGQFTCHTYLLIDTLPLPPPAWEIICWSAKFDWPPVSPTDLIYI